MVNAKQKRQPYPFFNGWGMTSKSIEHLTAENARTHTFDCLHFFDYQNREVPQSNFSGYAKIYLIAWSMGVYMSSLLQLPFTKKIAFCGTGNPIDAGEGIAPKIYTLTIDSFSEKRFPCFPEKSVLPWIRAVPQQNCGKSLLRYKVMIYQKLPFSTALS